MWLHAFWMLNLFSFHLISSHRSFSWKLLMPSHCHRSLCHPISSQLISSHVLSAFFTSSYPISILLSLAQLFAAGHNCSLLFSCHLSFSHLFSSHLSLSQGFLKFSQLFSILLSSPQLMSAHLMPSHLLFLFSHLLRSSHTSSADLRCCQLVSPHLSSAQRTLKSPQLFSGPKLAQTRISVPKQATPCTQQASAQRSLYTEAFTQGQGSLYIETRKPLLTTSFYTEQAFTHSKLLRTQAFAHRSFYTEKLLHREAFTQRTFYTQQAFTHIEKPVHRKAFTHSKLSHKEAPTQKSLYTEKLLHI